MGETAVSVTPTGYVTLSHQLVTPLFSQQLLTSLFSHQLVMPLFSHQLVMPLFLHQLVTSLFSHQLIMPLFPSSEVDAVELTLSSLAGTGQETSVSEDQV